MSQTVTRQRSFAASDVALHSPTPPIQPSVPSKIQCIQHSIMGKTYDLLAVSKTTKQSARWCVINLILAVLFYMECFQIMMTRVLDLQHFAFKYIDVLLAFVFSWNVIVNLYIYCLPTLSQQNVIVSPKQKKLLGITGENEKLFRVQDISATPQQACIRKSSSPSSYPMRRTSSRTTSNSSVLDYSPGRHQHSPNRNLQYSPSRSQYSPSRSQCSPDRDTTPLYSCGGQLRTTPVGSQNPHFSPYSGSSPFTANHGMSISSTPTSSIFLNNSGQSPSYRAKQTSPGRASNQDDQLLDYESLDKYIKKEEENELRNLRGQSDSPKGQSFWTYGRAAYEYMPSFGSYQLATRSKTPNLKDDDDTLGSPFKNDEMWRKLGLNKHDVDIWTENLRKWLAQTVLEPLVKEMTDINNRLTQMGSPELHIGTISYTSLQNVSTTKAQHLPSLPSVIPYLDVTMNQEYLFSRLQELSTGGCLRLYRWDSGGSYKSKPWNTDLPTDAQIICHLFCAYMDTHLPSNPRYADGKTFSGLHFLKTPSKPGDKKSPLCLYQSRTQNPHFKVLVEDEICDLPKGRNNLFHAIVVFLHCAKRNHHGMLERVNLGMSGINILHILEKK